MSKNALEAPASPPEKLQTDLPSIEEIECELENIDEEPEA